MEGKVTLNPALIEAGFSYALGAIGAVVFVGVCVAGFLGAAVILGELFYGIERLIRRLRARRATPFTGSMKDLTREDMD